MARWLLLASLVLSGLAGAARVNEYRPPTDEEQAAANARQKRMGHYAAGDLPAEEPFPWKAVGLAAIGVLVAVPFALRMFRQTSKEIVDAENAFNASVSPRKAKRAPVPPRDEA